MRRGAAALGRRPPWGAQPLSRPRGGVGGGRSARVATRSSGWFEISVERRRVRRERVLVVGGSSGRGARSLLQRFSPSEVRGHRRGSARFLGLYSVCSQSTTKNTIIDVLGGARKRSGRC